jgi:hypothetical protein
MRRAISDTSQLQELGPPPVYTNSGTPSGGAHDAVEQKMLQPQPKRQALLLSEDPPALFQLLQLLLRPQHLLLYVVCFRATLEPANAGQRQSSSRVTPVGLGAARPMHMCGRVLAIPAC